MIDHADFSLMYRLMHAMFLHIFLLVDACDVLKDIFVYFLRCLNIERATQCFLVLETINILMQLLLGVGDYSW